MRPCLANAKPDYKIVHDETFGPLLYLLTYRDFDEAIAIQNGVPQGLTSAVYTNDVREAEKFLSAVGSDCGIANVNTGTSGAEIGGAFGGEKETGGGRESGSDSWKSYMRRQTNTINYSTELPGAGNRIRQPGRRQLDRLTNRPGQGRPQPSGYDVPINRVPCPGASDAVASDVCGRLSKLTMTSWGAAELAAREKKTAGKVISELARREFMVLAGNKAGRS